MAGVTKEEIARAKRLDLLTYMKQYEPQELVKVGLHDYKTKTHDSLSISDNGKWHWCSRNMGGTTALNYLIVVKGMDFVSAVRYMNELQPGNIVYSQPVKKADAQKEKVPFVLPPADPNNRKVAAYLHGRGVSTSVLQYCSANKLLYQSSNGRYTNCIFLGIDEQGKPRSGVIRGCWGKFRGNIPGSEKEYGFCLAAADPDCSEVELYEAPIDAMSGASLRQLAGKEWQKVHYLAMGGLNYLALDNFLYGNPKVRQITLCMDDDKAGHIFTQKLTEQYTERGYVVKNHPPPIGKDYNDTCLLLQLTP